MAGAAYAAFAVVTAAAGYESDRKASSRQRKAEKNQERAQELQRNRELAKDAMERRSQIRQERVRRAQILQQSEGLGGVGSSGESGAVSSIGVDLGSNLGNMTAGKRASDAISSQMRQAQDYMGDARRYQEYGSIFKQASQMFGGMYSNSTKKPNTNTTVTNTGTI